MESTDTTVFKEAQEEGKTYWKVCYTGITVLKYEVKYEMSVMIV